MNWKYIAIGIGVVAIVGGVFMYSHLESAEEKQQKDYSTLFTKKSEHTNFTSSYVVRARSIQMEPYSIESYDTNGGKTIFSTSFDFLPLKDGEQNDHAELVELIGEDLVRVIIESGLRVGEPFREWAAYIVGIVFFKHNDELYIVVLYHAGASSRAALYTYKGGNLKRIENLLPKPSYEKEKENDFLLNPQRFYFLDDFVLIQSDNETFVVLKDDEVVSKKRFYCTGNLRCEYSLLEKNDSIFLKVKNGSTYVSTVITNKPCSLGSDCTTLVLANAAVDEYYLVDNQDNFAIRNKEQFREEYLKEAALYAQLIGSEDWEKLEEKGWRSPFYSLWTRLDVEKNWISALTGRTLNYIFAGEKEKALKEFSEDFDRFNAQYPVTSKAISSSEIKVKIEEELSSIEAI